MIKFKYNIMKNFRLFTLIILAFFFLTGAESYAYPRHRVCRVVYRVSPIYHTRVVRTYYIVKKTKKYHRHHKRIIRKVIYY